MVNQTTRILMLLVLLLGLLVVPCAAEIKVITLKHISAERILPALREVLEGQGRVSAWENRLIVNASPADIHVVEKVLEQLDVPPAMLRVSLRQDSRDGLAGGTVTGTGSAAKIADGTRHLGNVGEQVTQSLRLKDGSEGFLLVGEMLPYVRNMRVLTGRYAAFEQELDFQALNSGFWVRPILEEGFATVEIRPHLEGLQQVGPRTLGLPSPVELRELSSTLRVPLGTWVDLGSELREGDEVSRAILAWRTSSLQRQRILWIKIEAL